MDKKLELSIAMIVYNEEDRIRLTLESIKDIAGEIIAIDSFSQDKTCEILESYKAKVYKEKWQGFASQRNHLLSKCSKKYILYLDADEEINDELKKEIIKVVTSNNDEISGYYLRRKTYYLGKLLNYSWQKDKRLRLVKRDSNPVWHGEFVHEELLINGKTSVLPGYIIHHSYKDIEDHFRKTIKYAKLSAMSYNNNNKKFKLSKLIFNPILSFIKFYFVKLGFLDGIRGLIAATSALIYAFLKYTFLWEIEHSQKTKSKQKE